MWNVNEIMGIQVYLESKKFWIYVGTLLKDEDGYIFKYDSSYHKSKKAFSLGPDLPGKIGEFKSKSLFPFFDDSIPDKRNAAYPDYCEQYHCHGLSVDE